MLGVVRRMRVISKTVLVPNPTITTVDHQLGAFGLCDPASGIDRLPLSFMDRCRSLISFFLDRPALIVLDDMYVFLCHDLTPAQHDRPTADSRRMDYIVDTT